MDSGSEAKYHKGPLSSQEDESLASVKDSDDNQSVASNTSQLNRMLIREEDGVPKV